MSGTSVRVHLPGILDYESAWRWQREAVADVLRGGSERLAVLQHPPTYTLGRRSRPEHLLVSDAVLRARGACLVQSDRGGDVTFHGPGQLVAYPILDLRARGILPGDYIRALEAVVIDTLSEVGVAAERVPGRPGVFAGGGKIAAVGVRVQGGVSSHGLALNVHTDLAWFQAIVPCGLAGVRVTSLAGALGSRPAMAGVEQRFLAAFQRAFSCILEAETSNASEALALVR